MHCVSNRPPGGGGISPYEDQYTVNNYSIYLSPSNSRLLQSITASFASRGSSNVYQNKNIVKSPSFTFLSNKNSTYLGDLFELFTIKPVQLGKTCQIFAHHGNGNLPQIQSRSSSLYHEFYRIPARTFQCLFLAYRMATDPSICDDDDHKTFLR